MRTLVSLLLVGACECGATSHLPEDTGVTPVDAHVPEDTAFDAGIVPGEIDCDDVRVPDGRACIPEGWFLLAKWSTARSTVETVADPAPEQRVYLDAFLIDTREVTQGEYQAFVERSGSASLPERCGYNDYQTGEFPREETQVSGWSEGSPSPELLDHPVVCVTRFEAQAYCEAAGGRLPTVVQHMKAARGPADDRARYPWGDTPPSDDPTGFDSSAFVEQYVWFGADYVLGRLHTAPTSGRLLGSSPHGVFDLVGNVTEILSTCEEDLSVYPGVEPLVRPREPAREECGTAALIAGSNWKSLSSGGGHLTAGSPTIFRYRFGAPPDYVGTNLVTPDVSFHPWIEPIDGEAGTDPAGNDRRSWRVGFRCAYDLPDGS